MRIETVVRVPGVAPGASRPAVRRKLTLIGGSGGIGTALYPLLEEDFYVLPTSSASYDVVTGEQLNGLVDANYTDILIFAAVRNHDAVVHRTSPREVYKQVAVTCEGLANVLRACLPPMREQRFGRVIFLSSVVARQPVPGAGIYGACKAFGEQLIRTAAVENAGHGVTCNSIRMGYFEAGLKDRMSPEHQAAALETIPAGRWGSVVELARVIRCIVETEYINGATIDLTGGL